MTDLKKIVKKRSRHLYLVFVLFTCELNVFSFFNEIKHSYSISYISINDITLKIDSPLRLQINDSIKHIVSKCELIIDSLYFQHSPELLNAYIFSGKYFISKYEFDKALKCLKTAEEILDANNNNDSYLYGVIYHYIGNIYDYKAQNERAIKYYEKTMNLAKEHEILSEYIRRNYRNLAGIHFSLFNFNIAIDYCIRYLQLPKTSIKDKIECYSRLSNCYRAINKIEEAEYYIQLAEKYAIRHLGAANSELSNIYSIKSYIYIKTGNNDKRLNYLNNAIEISALHNPFKSRKTSFALRNLGEYYCNIKDYKKSLYTLHKAIIAITKEFNDTNIYSNPDIHDAILKINLLYLLKYKAYSFYFYYEQVTGDINDLKASLECYELAVELHEKIYAGFITEKSKLNFIGKQRKNLNNTIEVALDVYEVTEDVIYAEKALSYAEKSKSAVLLAYLNDEKDKNFAGIPDSLINKEKKLRNEIANLNFRINSKNGAEFTTDEEYNGLKSRLFKLYRDEEEMIANYEDNFPEYYNLKYNITATSLKQIQSILDESQTILEYTITWKELYTFIITRNNISVYTQDIDSTFLGNIMKMREILSENKFGNYDIDDFRNFVKISYDLYEILISPVTGLIKDKNLIIIPDETLNLIPFEVLITSDSVTSDYANFGDLPYLFKQYPISYSYSASLLLSQRESKYPGKKITAFVPEYTGLYHYSDSLNDSINNEVYKLLPLSGAEEEVNYISKFYKGKIYRANQALEENFKKSPARHNIIHFAMHTIIDDKNPMYSRMVFTPGKDKVEDGLLHTFELYSMKLKTNLVVLSSCNTGYGKMQKGEGLLSLARGFIYSGCSSLILTQWAVTDRAGSTLMKSFYYYLSKGNKKDKSLQNAKIDYLKNADPVKTHPYYWAGYIAFGDSSPLPSKHGYTKYLVIFILFTVITVGYFLRKKNFR